MVSVLAVFNSIGIGQTFHTTVPGSIDYTGTHVIDSSRPLAVQAPVSKMNLRA